MDHLSPNEFIELLLVQAGSSGPNHTYVPSGNLHRSLDVVIGDDFLTVAA